MLVRCRGFAFGCSARAMLWQLRLFSRPHYGVSGEARACHVLKGGAQVMNRFGLPLRLTGLCHCLAFVQFAAAQVGPDIVVKVVEFEHDERLGPVGGGIIGAAIGTTGCNAGDEVVNWFQLPDTDHPVFPSNFYRLMTVEGSTRFEQIGQSWVKHGHGAAQDDECGFGCTPLQHFTQLGVGCSDTYGAGQALVPCDLGPRFRH